MRSAQVERVRCLLVDTITCLCRNGLEFDSGVSIQGVLGITVDGKDVFIVHMNETLSAADGNRIDFSKQELYNAAPDAPPETVNNLHPKLQSRVVRSAVKRRSFRDGNRRLWKNFHRGNQAVRTCASNESSSQMQPDWPTESFSQYNESTNDPIEIKSEPGSEGLEDDNQLPEHFTGRVPHQSVSSFADETADDSSKIAQHLSEADITAAADVPITSNSMFRCPQTVGRKIIGDVKKFPSGENIEKPSTSLSPKQGHGKSLPAPRHHVLLHGNSSEQYDHVSYVNQSISFSNCSSYDQDGEVTSVDAGTNSSSMPVMVKCNPMHVSSLVSRSAGYHSQSQYIANISYSCFCGKSFKHQPSFCRHRRKTHPEFNLLVRQKKGLI